MIMYSYIDDIVHLNEKFKKLFMKKEEFIMAGDIKLMNSTQPSYFDTTSSASLAAAINAAAAGILAVSLGGGLVATAVAALAGTFSFFYPQVSFKGYVRYFTYKDLSTGVVRTEQYRYLSYTDAQNDRGGIFMGAVDKNGRAVYNKM